MAKKQFVKTNGIEKAENAEHVTWPGTVLGKFQFHVTLAEYKRPVSTSGSGRGNGAN